MEGNSDVPRVLFVNENLGGHATMHTALRRALPGMGTIRASFLDVEQPGVLRRLAAIPVPGLARLDLDFQPLRYQLAQSFWVRRRLRALPDPDVVHAYTHNTVLLSSQYLRSRASVVSLDKTGFQNSVSLPYRSPTRFTHLTARTARLFERRVYAAATSIVAQSEWAARSLRDDYGVPLGKITVIPFGGVAPPAPRRRPRTEPMVTFIGTTMERKGGWELLEAYQRFLSDRCRLTLVTKDPVPSYPGVAVISDLAPGDDRLWEILAGTDVFAFPSRIDAFGYSMLEAMSMEVPVVARSVGAVDEIVEDGVTGLIVGSTTSDLAHGILTLLDDPERRTSMGVAGRRRVLQKFDPEVTTKALLDCLEETRRRYEASRPVD